MFDHFLLREVSATDGTLPVKVFGAARSGRLGPVLEYEGCPAHAAFERLVALDLLEGELRLRAAMRARREALGVVAFFVIHGVL